MRATRSQSTTLRPTSTKHMSEPGLKKGAFIITGITRFKAMQTRGPKVDNIVPADRAMIMSRFKDSENLVVKQIIC